MTGKTFAVIAEAVRRSPLAGYADRFAALHEAGGGALSIRELPFLAQLNLRAGPTDEALMQRLADALSLALPCTPNTVASTDDRRALWLGPDEWLVVGPEDQRQGLEAALRSGLGGTFGSIVDVSANRTVLQARGIAAPDLLARGVPLDLHPVSFPAGHCAQTLLARTQVIIECRDEDSGFYLLVRSSFAGYVADWLLDAAASWLDTSPRAAGRRSA